MIVRNLGKLTIIVGTCLFLAACESSPTMRTTALDTWKLDHYDKKLAKILIVSISDEPGIRDKVESIVARKFGQEGVRASASYEIMPPNAEINRDTVKAAILGKGYDGVLVSRLLSVDRSTAYVQPSLDLTFENSFNPVAPRTVTPGYVQHQSVVSVQTDLYDVASEDLVWSLKTQTINLDTVTNLVNHISDLVIKDLRNKKLI